MKRIYCLFLLTGFLFFFSCASDDDSDVRRGGEQSDINKFVWRAMNEYYYWQDEVPDLSDNLKNTNRYNDLINHNSPEDLFNQLLYSEDGKNGRPYSVIKSDYTELENLFNGVLPSTGFHYVLIKRKSGNIALLVLYVTQGSESKTKGLKRGDIITKINDTPIPSEYVRIRSLLSQSTLQLELSEYKKIEGKSKLIPTGEIITIHPSQKQENPIVFDTVFTRGSKRIGYLFYTDFFREYNDELNEVFAKLRSKGANELILDLRYNGGGSVETSTYLASMITGQFKGKTYTELRYNSKQHHQSINFKFRDKMNIYELENDCAVRKENINHLNLKRLVVIGTGNTASASELIINGLKGVDFPVTLVGKKTNGKNVASVTLYDSPNFRKENVNPDHRYAMQPIVAKSYNAKRESNYSNGFSPNIPTNDIDISDLSNISPLGDPEEPMLKAALCYIEPGVYNAKRSNKISTKDKIPFKMLLFSKDLNPFNKDMVIKINE